MDAETNDLLTDLISSQQLDEYIKTNQSNLKKTCAAFRLKNQRRRLNPDEPAVKLEFKLYTHYSNPNNDISLICQLIQNALPCLVNRQIELDQLTEFCQYKCVPSTRKLNLVYQIILNAEDEQLKLDYLDLNQFFIEQLNNSSNRVLILNKVLPLYLGSSSTAISVQVNLVEVAFKECCSSADLEPFSALLNLVLNRLKLDLRLNTDFLLNQTYFWEFIAESLTTVQIKQASFCLNTSLNYVERTGSLDCLRGDEISWQAYISLLDLVQEKQLHLIEPSLTRLLSLVQGLNGIWLSAIYKILFNHSERNVVQLTVNYFIQTSKLADSGILREFLAALNRNQCYILDSELQHNLIAFRNNLNETSYKKLLNQLAEVTNWNSIALFCLIGIMFGGEKIQVGDDWLKSFIFKVVANLQHIYLRHNAIYLLLKQFSSIEFTSDEIGQLAKFCNIKLLLSNFDTKCEIAATSNADALCLEWRGDIVLLERMLDQSSHRLIDILRLCAAHQTELLMDKERYVSFMTKCLNLALLELSKSGAVFREALKLVVDCVFYENKLVAEVHGIVVKLVEVAEGLNDGWEVALHLAKKMGNCGEKFVDVQVKMALMNMVVKRDERMEYLVCHGCKAIGCQGLENPNQGKLQIRIITINSIINQSRLSATHADQYARHLIALYNMHYKKRYFPNSEVHLKKLRIVQILLLIEPYLTNQMKSELISLIVSSFSEETHQPCIRQLMQWLLIRLLAEESQSGFVDWIADRVKMADLAKPSAVSAFIPVLLHLVRERSDETEWIRVVELLVGWTMGQNFKLRVYSQVAILKLCTEAQSKKYTKFSTQFHFLHSSISAIQTLNPLPFEATLKTDSIFIHHLNPFLEQNATPSVALYYIPRLNSVQSSEWSDIADYYPENLQFSALNVEERNITEEVRETPCTVYEWQRKATPWKQTNRGNGELIVVASLLEKAANLGGLVRTSEVFGVALLVVADLKVVKAKDFSSVSMTADKWVNDMVEVKVADLGEWLGAMRESGYEVVGAEQTTNSVGLEKFEFKKKTVLVLGNEKSGIPAHLIGHLDHCIEIPQVGQVRSLNVHVAGATCIWEYTKQQLLK